MQDSSRDLDLGTDLWTWGGKGKEGGMNQETGTDIYIHTAATATKSLQSCPTLCNPTDSSPPGFSVPGILQARLLEWVAISFSNVCMYAKLLQSCPILCDPTDRSPSGSSVHRILQAGILIGLPFPSPNVGYRF